MVMNEATDQRSPAPAASDAGPLNSASRPGVTIRCSFSVPGLGSCDGEGSENAMQAAVVSIRCSG